MNISRDVEVADCRWQSFCDLTESADENRPLRYFAYIPFGCRGRRPRRPINANEHNKISQMITKNITPILGAIKGIALAIPCLGIWQASDSPASLRDNSLVKPSACGRGRILPPQIPYLYCIFIISHLF